MKLQCYILVKCLGTKNGPRFDIAVDPVEGTNFVANNLPGGISSFSYSRKWKFI